MPFEPDWGKRFENRSGSGGPRDSRDSHDPGQEIDLFGNRIRPPAAIEPPEPAPAPAPAPAPPRRRRRLRSGALLTAVLVLLALVVGGAGGLLLGRGQPRAEAVPEVQVITRPVPQVPPECGAAVGRADDALGLAAQLQKALAEHTRYMDQLMQGEISGARALHDGMPSLLRAARVSARLDGAVAKYRDLARQCQPTP